MRMLALRVYCCNGYDKSGCYDDKRVAIPPVLLSESTRRFARVEDIEAIVGPANKSITIALDLDAWRSTCSQEHSPISVNVHDLVAVHSEWSTFLAKSSQEAMGVSTKEHRRRLKHLFLIISTSWTSRLTSNVRTSTDTRQNT